MKSTFRRLIVSILTLFVLATPRAHSQESIYKRGETYLEQSLMPTPEASSIVKHSDLPVDHATGAFSFSVPLHTLEGRELSVPAKSFEEDLAYSPAGMIERIVESGSRDGV